MKKKLNTDSVVSELRGSSVFFPTKNTETENPPPKPVSPSVRNVNPQPSLKDQEIKPKANAVVSSPTKKPPQVSPVESSMQASKNASTLASKQDSMLEDIRHSIKVQGKEVTYVRLTQEEKNQLADIIYSYKRQGIRTSETEVSRIAINYLLEDYRINGKTSILARMFEVLNA